MEALQGVPIKRVSFVRADVEYKLVSIEEVIDFISYDQHMFTMRSYLFTNLFIRQGLLELIKASHKYLFLSLLVRTKTYTVV